MVTATIREGSKRTFSVVVVDHNEARAEIQAVPQWSVAPEGGVTLSPAVDGLSCEVSYLSAMSRQLLAVTVEVDLGQGSRRFTQEFSVITVANAVTPPFRGGFVSNVGPESAI